MGVILYVQGHFSASHRDSRGQLHGHTWDVRASFAVGADLEELRDKLDKQLSFLDHTILPEKLSSSEAIAAHIGQMMPGCLAVEAARLRERMGARWER